LKHVVVKPNKKAFVPSQTEKSELNNANGFTSADFLSNKKVTTQSNVVGQSQILSTNSSAGELLNGNQTLVSAPNKAVEEVAASNPVEIINNAENQLIFCDPRGIFSVSLGMSQMKVEFIEIPEGEYEKAWDPARYRSKWYGEMGATTGSKVIVDFDNKNALSVLGTMYHANYQGLILRDMGNGIMLGTGISYGEWIGNGEWQLTQTERKTLIDSYDLVVMIPPVQTVRVYDTTEVIDTKVTTGEIHYKIDKVSLPLAMRYNFMLGKVAWRLAAQVNPGITTKTTGDYFTKTEYHPISEQRMLCMDAKLAFGPSFALTTAWTLVLEPNAMLHSFYDKSGKRTYSKVLTGFGMTVVRKF